MSALVFGWARRKKRPDESQVTAAAEAAALEAGEDGGPPQPLQDAGVEGGGGGGGADAHGRRGVDGGARAPPEQDGEEPPGRIDPTSIEVSDVPILLDEVIAVRGKALVAGAASLREALIPRLERLDALLDELEEDDLDTEDADRRVQAVVERSKRQIISIIGQEVRAALPTVETADDAMALAEATARMLRKTGDVLGRQTRFMHAFGKKYAGRIKPILGDTEDDYKALLALTVGHRYTTDAAGRILKDIELMDRSGRSAERLRSRAAELDSRLARLRARGSEIGGEIEGVKASPEYGALGRLREELEAVRGRRAAARRGASDRFTKISKPLSRYEYVSAMDKEKMALLRAVIDDPFEAVAAAGAGAVSEILGAVRRAVDSGSVTVKDKAKAVHLLDEEAGRLASYKRDADEMARREADIGARIAKADTGRLDALESERAKNEAEAADTEAKVRQMRAEADESEGRMPATLAKIESAVSEITGVRYTVRPDGGGG